MTDQSTNLRLPYLMPSQAQKHVTVNEAVRRLDALVQTAAESRSVTAQPGAPDDGAVWIVPPGKTGAEWSLFANYALAYYRDGAWEEIQPKEGWRAYVRDEGATLVFDGAYWASETGASSGALSGERNALLNGDFSIWQRGASERPDMWKVSATGGVTHAFSRQSFAPGAPLGAGNGEPEYFMRWAMTGATTAGASAIGASIENVRTFAGEDVTLSFWAKASTALNLRSYLAQRFGSGGSSTVWTPSATFALTTSWQKFTRTVSLASISGKTIGAGNHLQVYFDCYSALTDPSIDIARIQIEPGSAATRFERRPYALELAACQRYFERFTGQTYARFAMTQADATTAASGVLHYAPKRAVPSLAYGGTIYVRGGASNQAVSALALTYSTPEAGRARIEATSSGLVVGRAYELLAWADATAYLDLDAEL